MKTCKLSLIATAIASVLAFSAVPTAFAGDAEEKANASAEKSERMVGQVIDDATITASVKTKLLADERTKGFDINVDTHKGKVTLRGGAGSVASKMAATKLAHSAEGVLSVDNMLVVAAVGTEARKAANTATASGKVREGMSETGEVINDAWITTKVKAKLLADERTKGFDINVDTLNGNVTLRGGADSVANKMAATKLAHSADGVISVDNQLVVAAEGTEARQAANTATASGEVRDGLSDTGEVINDAWITTKVKTKLLADENVAGNKITVKTKDNVVHLVGVVESSEERAAAIRIAERTEGVRDVDADDLHVRDS
jgi:hyperosmotically inducible periplasmic protein